MFSYFPNIIIVMRNNDYTMNCVVEVILPAALSSSHSNDFLPNSLVPSNFSCLGYTAWVQDT